MARAVASCLGGDVFHIALAICEPLQRVASTSMPTTVHPTSTARIARGRPT